MENFKKQQEHPKDKIKSLSNEVLKDTYNQLKEMKFKNEELENLMDWVDEEMHKRGLLEFEGAI